MGENKLSPEEHKARHKELHARLDELVADWITRTAGMPSQSTVLELMYWSARQIESPTEEA